VADEPLYNLCTAISFPGGADRPVAAASVREVVRRNEILRSRFQVVVGSPVVRILPALAIAVPLVDLGALPPEPAAAELERLGRAFVDELHDLDAGPSWPMTLFFRCAQPPATQGATPLADTRQVLRTMDRAVAEEFRARGYLIVRNFGEFGVPWSDAFGTGDRAAVDLYCAEHRITTEWIGDRLRTTAVREAIRRHPVTGDEVWFNHAAIFHVSTHALRSGRACSSCSTSVTCRRTRTSGTAR